MSLNVKDTLEGCEHGFKNFQGIYFVSSLYSDIKITTPQNELMMVQVGPACH